MGAARLLTIPLGRWSGARKVHEHLKVDRSRRKCFAEFTSAADSTKEVESKAGARNLQFTHRSLDDKGIIGLRIGRMLARNGLRTGARVALRPWHPRPRCRHLHDGRSRLTTFWTPTQNASPSSSSNTAGAVDTHDLLLRAGILRQAHSGIFHFLTLGQRIQSKLEALIDKHMLALGASKVSLSSLTSEDLWAKSGRLEKGRGSEFFRLKDRKGTKLLLSPTHEEEITTIVANAVTSYRDLPLRLWQVGRKYRDEARPRQGMLRGREFVMKDLYTFDVSEEAARETYEEVRKAYCKFLDELRLPYLVANADSGTMGGSLSHEYHFASDSGEDTVIQCDCCGYSVNEELFIGAAGQPPVPLKETKYTWFLHRDDPTNLICVFHRAETDINVHALKRLSPLPIAANIDSALTIWQESLATQPGKITILHDSSVTPLTPAQLTDITNIHDTPATVLPLLTTNDPNNPNPSLLAPQHDDHCPACSSGKLSLHRAIEIGHTFHLSTRYSQPLDLSVTTASNTRVPVSMGCHGIGLSRLVAASASLLSIPTGLGWPAAIAPFQAVILPLHGTAAGPEERLFDRLAVAGVDAVIDDRPHVGAGWKFRDAETVGYPVVLVLGRGWREGRGVVEVRCERLGVRGEEVGVEEVVGTVKRMVEKL